MAERKVKVPNIKTGAKASAKALREQTFQVHGPQLFNSLPPYLRNMRKCSVEIFKEELDKYLMTIPDEPSVPGLTPAATTPDARPPTPFFTSGHYSQGERRGGGGQDLAPEREPGKTSGYKVAAGA